MPRQKSWRKEGWPPPVKKEARGAMNRVARSMGYEDVASIPQGRLDEFAVLLVERYGAKRAWGMSHRQVLFRKRQQPEQRKRFEYIRDYIGRHYTTIKVNGWRTRPRSRTNG